MLMKSAAYGWLEPVQLIANIDLRYQLWPLDKKVRVIEQAKMYLKRHESEMEERLAQSKTFASRLRQAQLWVIRLAMVKNWKLII
jgi:hypothetical protein